jgi:hypothetical protein
MSESATRVAERLRAAGDHEAAGTIDRLVAEQLRAKLSTRLAPFECGEVHVPHCRCERCW